MEITGNWARENWHKGRQEGRQEGEVQGRHEGQVELVQRLLEHKFGALPVRLRRALQKLQAEQLTELGVALLSFSSRAELEAWLTANK